MNGGSEKRKIGAEKRKSGAEKRKSGAEKKKKGVWRREKRGCGEEKVYFGATVLHVTYSLTYEVSGICGGQYSKNPN